MPVESPPTVKEPFMEAPIPPARRTGDAERPGDRGTGDGGTRADLRGERRAFCAIDDRSRGRERIGDIVGAWGSADYQPGKSGMHRSPPGPRGHKRRHEGPGRPSDVGCPTTLGNDRRERLR